MKITVEMGALRDFGKLIRCYCVDVCVHDLATSSLESMSDCLIVKTIRQTHLQRVGNKDDRNVSLCVFVCRLVQRLCGGAKILITN